MVKSIKLAVHSLDIPYGTKILHGIKFYDFTVVGTTIKLTFIIVLQRYQVASIAVKFKIRQPFLIQ